MNTSLFAATFALAGILPLTVLSSPDYPIQPVPFTQVNFTDGLWHGPAGDQ